MRFSKIGIAEIGVLCLTTLLLLTPGACGPTQEKRAEAEVEDVVEAFYKALGGNELDKLAELTVDPLAEAVGEIEGNATVEDILGKYKDADIKVDEVEIDGDEAEAKVLLRREYGELTQTVELERDKGEWKVADYRYEIEGMMGGVEMTIGVHVDEAVEREIYDVMDLVQNMLDENDLDFSLGVANVKFDESLPYKQLLEADTGLPSIEIALTDDSLWSDLQAVIDSVSEAVEMRGWSLTAEMPSRIMLSMTTVGSVRRTVMEQMRESLEERLGSLEIPFPAVLIKGDPETSREILIHLPGVGDSDAVKRIIYIPAYLQFRAVVHDEQGLPYESASREELLARLGGELPPGTELVPEFEQPRPIDLPDRRTPFKWYLLYRAAPVDGRFLETTEASRDAYGQPTILFTLNSEGGERMKRLTGANIGRMLAIVLDGECIMAGRIEGEIGAEGQITGRYTLEEAEQLALALKTGALPVSFHFIEERAVEAGRIW